MTWTPLINVIGTIAATLMSYNISTGITEKIVYPSYMQYVPMLARRFAKKIMMVQSVIEMILLVPLIIFTLWMFNTLVLQTNILWECHRINFDTWHAAAINALSGAISCSIIILVWNILTLIPILKFLIILESLYIVPTLMIIFNLSFGAGLGNALALNEACAPTPPPSDDPNAPQPKSDINIFALLLYVMIILSPMIVQYLITPGKRLPFSANKGNVHPQQPSQYNNYNYAQQGQQSQYDYSQYAAQQPQYAAQQPQYAVQQPQGQYNYSDYPI